MNDGNLRGMHASHAFEAERTRILAQTRRPSMSPTSPKTESIACTPAACAAFTTRARKE